MLDISSSDLDVERLMYEIRKNVAREHAAPDPVPHLSNGESAAEEMATFRLQPAFEPRADNIYQLNDLLRFHGADFVRNAYRALLLREPDAVGMAYHLDRLASGRFNKIDVLASLQTSPEGRESQVRVAGLSNRAAIRRLGRVPVIGYFLRLLIAIGRLPVMLQHQNQFEFYSLSLQQRIVEHQNDRQRELSNALVQLSDQVLETAAEQRQAIGLSLQRHEELVARQNDLQRIVEAGFDEARRSVEDLTNQTQQLLKQQQQLLIEKQQAIIQQQNDEREERLSRQQQTDEQIQQLLHRQHRAHDELVMQERRVTVLLEEVRQNAATIPASSFAEVARDEEDHLLDGLYASFEDQFRGERDEVRRRLQVYVPFLTKAQIRGDVLDIGCGRGEWLELLKSEGIECQGLDRNRVFVEECKRAGLNVVETDALVYLRSLPSASLNAVTSFHLVEHLPFETLIRLIEEIVRVLRHGAVLILETPNPENFMVGSCNFYADPTHRHPIPSETLQFLLESRGLHDIEVLKLRPWEAAKLQGDSELIRRFNEYFYCAPDYGIVARKPLSSTV